VRKSRHQIAIAPGASSANIVAMRYVMAILFAMAIAARPAVAGDPAAADLWGPPRAWPPVEGGKPVIRPQPPKPLENCASGMPCGLRLLGDIRRNGAVELQVPALRW